MAFNIYILYLDISLTSHNAFSISLADVVSRLTELLLDASLLVTEIKLMTKKILIWKTYIITPKIDSSDRTKK